MRRRWPFFFSLALNLLLLAVLGLIASNHWQLEWFGKEIDRFFIGAPVGVVVINASQHQITDIHITHRHGGLIYIPNLESGQEFRQTMNPTRGANLRMSYQDHDKQLKVTEPGDIYTGTNNNSTVTIRVDNEGVTADQKP